MGRFTEQERAEMPYLGCRLLNHDVTQLDQESVAQWALSIGQNSTNDDRAQANVLFHFAMHIISNLRSGEPFAITCVAGVLAARGGELV